MNATPILLRKGLATFVLALTGTLILPWTDVTQAQSPSPIPASSQTLPGTYIGLVPWICLSQAFCDPHE